MNNAPAPESEQAGSGRVMRFCWDLQNSGSSLPQRGVHGFDDLLGLGVRLDEHLCGPGATCAAPALAPAPTPVAVAAATPGGDEPATIDMQVLAKFA